MSDAIPDIKKRGRGRPKTGIGPMVGLRLYPALDAALDAWISSQPEPHPSRPHAIRQLLIKALGDDAREPS
jgi:hypothetical protein